METNNPLEQLPIAELSSKHQESHAFGKAWHFDITLTGTRPFRFLALIALDSDHENHEHIGNTVQTLFKETILYQKSLFEGNRISITNEDFFEQLLQKINAELSLYLQSLPELPLIKSWSMLFGMVAPSDHNGETSEFHVSRFGSINGWLVHNAQLQTTKLISIFDMPDTVDNEVRPQKFFRNIISSELSNNDHLFFCTQNILNPVSLSELKKILTTLSPQGALKQLENLVPKTAQSPLFVALYLKLKAYKDKEAHAQSPNLDKAAETSMSSLLTTESRTEELLSNSVLMHAKSALHTIKSQATSKTKRQGSSPQNLKEPVSKKASSTFKQQKQTKVKKVLASTQAAFSVITSVFPKRTEKKNSMEFLPQNKAVTKVNIFTTQLKETLAPFVNRFTPFISSLKKSIDFKRLFSPGGIALFTSLIAIVIVFSIYRSNRNFRVEQEQLAASALEQVNQNLDQIDSYLIVGRDSDAIALTEEVASQLTSLSENEFFTGDVAEQQARLDDQQRDLRKETLITSDSLFSADVSSQLSSTPEHLVLTDDTLYVMGSTPSTGLEVALSDATTSSLSLSTDIQTINDFAYNADRDEFVLLSESSVVTLDTLSSTENAVTLSIPSASRASAFYNNRLYRLAPEENQIYRSGVGNYRSYAEWITEASLPLAQAQDLAIDGAIYVLRPDGIVTFLSGQPAQPQVTLDQISPRLASAEHLWTSTDSARFYITEPSRLILFSKQGVFQRQFVFEDTSEQIQDFAVDESTRSVYILTTQNLYKISL